MQFSLKERYSERIGKGYGNIDLTRDRILFGKREIETIILLAQYFFPQSILSKHAENRLNNKEVRLIDIGCGDRYISYGCDHYGFEYDGIDFGDCNVELDRIQRDESSFDIVIALALLEHLTDPSNLISEAYRILKKDGLLILSTPNWKYCTKDFYDDPTHVHPYTPKSLNELLKFSSFSSTKIVPNLRCQQKKAYLGKSAYFRAANLRFFPNAKPYLWLPSCLRGKARGIFGISMK